MAGALLAVLAVGLAPVAPGFADAGKGEAKEHRVVVCKYVSTPPGELHHVVIVDDSTLKDWPGTFPWQFADKQVSVALRWADEGEQAHDVDPLECATVVTPPGLTVTDECGVGNAVWGEVPDGPWTAQREDDGSIVLTAAVGYAFPGLATTHSYPAPVETNTAACPGETEEPEEPELVGVPTVPVLDECGPGNAAYGAVPAGDYTVVRNEDGSVTLTVTAGHTFPEGRTTITLPTPVDSNEPCAETSPTALVACVYPSDDAAPTPAATLFGSIRLIDVADAVLRGFAGTFPFEWDTETATIVLQRFAAIDETAETIPATLCGEVGGEVDEEVDDPEGDPGDPGDPVDDADDVTTVVDTTEDAQDAEDGDVAGETADVTAAVLPDTGGPDGLLLLLGAGLVLGGALLVARRSADA